MVSKQKIIIISPAHPLRGGIAASGERLAQAFQEQGHEVVIYSFSLQYPNILFPGKTQFSDDPKPADLKIITAINAINPLSWWRVGRQIARENPDLVICRFWMPFFAPSLGTILRIIKRKTHAKVLALVDNIIPHEKRIGDQALSRYFTSACDGFMVMSRSVGEEIKVFSDAPVKFTPHPIYDIYGEKIERSAAISFLKLNENTRYLLFFGLIRKYKGLDLLIEALGILKQRDFFKKYDIKLLVAGEFYEEESAYRNLIKTLNVENQVIIRANFIPNDEVKYYFEASDLIVQPYRTATQSGISQIAYHFEKPMLVTNVGGLPEIVANGKAGYVVEPTPQLIADAIEDFYMHDRAKAFIPHVISHKKNFTWEAMVEGFLSLSQSNV